MIKSIEISLPDTHPVVADRPPGHPASTSGPGREITVGHLGQDAVAPVTFSCRVVVVVRPSMGSLLQNVHVWGEGMRCTRGISSSLSSNFDCMENMCLTWDSGVRMTFNFVSGNVFEKSTSVHLPRMNCEGFFQTV